MTLILPGTLVAKKPINTDYTYVENGNTYAAVIGIYDGPKERFIPLKGPYIPSVRDLVVGVVEEERHVGYEVDIFSPYKGFIFSKRLRESFNQRNILMAEVASVSEVKDVMLSRPRRLIGGRLMLISPTKVSRLIGRNSSMINIIKSKTKCDIIVGKNGGVWIKGDKIQLAIDTIMKIEREAHTKGLTDKIDKFLSQELKE